MDLSGWKAKVALMPQGGVYASRYRMAVYMGYFLVKYLHSESSVDDDATVLYKCETVPYVSIRPWPPSSGQQKFPPRY